MKGFHSTLSQFKTHYFWDHTLTQPLAQTVAIRTLLWHQTLNKAAKQLCILFPAEGNFTSGELLPVLSFIIKCLIRKVLNILKFNKKLMK